MNQHVRLYAVPQSNIGNNPLGVRVRVIAEPTNSTVCMEITEHVLVIPKELYHISLDSELYNHAEWLCIVFVVLIVEMC